MEIRSREGIISVLSTWTLLFLILMFQFPVVMPGINEFYIEGRLFDDDLVPEVVYLDLLPTDYDCRDEDDLSSILEIIIERNLKRYEWKVYISPFFVRHNRMLNLDGNHKRMPFPHVDELLDRNVRTVFWGVMLMYPFFVLLAFILIVAFSRLGGEFFHAFFIYSTHPKLRNFFRRIAINRQKKLRQLEIDFTPDYSKIERKYRLFVLFRRTSDDSEPDELKDFDFDLLVSNKRIILDPPMMIKFGYYFEKKNLTLDSATKMIVPLPEPEDNYALTFEELQMIKAEQVLLDKRTMEVGEDRKKYSQARRLVYNIPKARYYAVQQGLPYLVDVNRREIMLQVKKARREKRKQDAAAVEAANPDPHRKKPKPVDWTRTPKLLKAHRKMQRLKPHKPSILPTDEPNQPVKRGKHYSPRRFDPKVAGGGILSENEWKERRWKQKRTKKPEYHLTPAELEGIRRQVEDEARRASAEDKETRAAVVKELESIEKLQKNQTGSVGPLSVSAISTNAADTSVTATAPGSAIDNDVFVFADDDDDLNYADDVETGNEK